ncbi:hypothetical protein Ga0061079_1119 [Apibacter mensalis]|uniref:Uncharacterized protein n=1 Tax=Apibacter mensalis TaxID=1586267 RepID=A0A0X3ARU5_9FLAO|nr:hypothetical protein Ga0061079_1119 [Apibacter mensalis]
MNVIFSPIAIYKSLKKLLIYIYHTNTNPKIKNYNKESKALLKSE